MPPLAKPPTRRSISWDAPALDDVRLPEGDNEVGDDMDFGQDGNPRPETGVSIQWLCTAFGVSRVTAMHRLADVRPVRYSGSNRPLWRVKDAASKLVKGDIDVAQQISKMRPQDMPPMLQAVFWDGQNKRLDFMKKAALLWHTDDVVEVLSDMFKSMRSTMQLWVDSVDKEAKLTPEQVEALRRRVDALQDEIYRDIQDRVVERRTTPVSDSPMDQTRPKKVKGTDPDV